MMHGPPEAEGGKTRITLPLFVPSDPSKAARIKFASDGEEPCDHPWDFVYYPTYKECPRCVVSFT
jgi:hypothetical protein